MAGRYRKGAIGGKWARMGVLIKTIILSGIDKVKGVFTLGGGGGGGGGLLIPLKSQDPNILHV